MTIKAKTPVSGVSLRTIQADLGSLRSLEEWPWEAQGFMEGGWESGERAAEAIEAADLQMAEGALDDLVAFCMPEE